jgi:hypothetical protein
MSQMNGKHNPKNVNNISPPKTKKNKVKYIAFLIPVRIP